MEPYGKARKAPARPLQLSMTDAEQSLWQRIYVGVNG